MQPVVCACVRSCMKFNHLLPNTNNNRQQSPYKVLAFYADEQRFSFFIVIEFSSETILLEIALVLYFLLLWSSVFSLLCRLDLSVALLLVLQRDLFNFLRLVTDAVPVITVANKTMNTFHQHNGCHGDGLARNAGDKYDVNIFCLF